MNAEKRFNQRVFLILVWLMFSWSEISSKHLEDALAAPDMQFNRIMTENDMYRVYAVKSSPALPNILLATSDYDDSPHFPVYSLDGGRNWQALKTKPWSGPVDGLVVPRYLPGAPVRFVITIGNYLFRTGDYGATWSYQTFSTPEGLSERSIGDLIASPADPTKLFLTAIGCDYFGCAGSSYKSSDGGVTWEKFTFEGRDSIFRIIPSPAASSRLYLVDLSETGVYGRSDDGGLTWSYKHFPVYPVPDPGNADRIYGVQEIWDPGLKRYLLVSVDGGDSWETLTYPSSNSCSLSVPLSGVLFLYCSEDGTYLSSDGGSNWVSLNYNYAWSQIDPDYGNPGRILWLRYDGLWASDDKGSSWIFLTSNYGFQSYPNYVPILFNFPN